MPVDALLDQERLVDLTFTAANDVFQMMLGMDVTAGNAHTEQSVPQEDDLIVTLIGITGPWMGTGMIRCKSEFACKIASCMLMTDYSDVNEDVLDAMAEMSNMVFGNVKTNLEEVLGNLGLSIPTVIYGSNFATRGVGKQTWIVMPLHSGADSMELRLCLAKNSSESHAHRPRVRL